MAILSGQSAFYYLAAVSVASAILAITRSNPVHSMLWVLALFVHVAGIFLFFLMLLDLPGETAGPRFGTHWPLAAAAGLGFAALAWYAHDPRLVPAMQPVEPLPRSPGSLRSIGMALFTQFTLPFEITSLILLAAIVGAVVVAKRKNVP